MKRKPSEKAPQFLQVPPGTPANPKAIRAAVNGPWPPSVDEALDDPRLLAPSQRRALPSRPFSLAEPKPLRH